MKKRIWLLQFFVLAGISSAATFDVVIQTTEPNQKFVFLGEWAQNFNIDWGDGEAESNLTFSANRAHTYLNAGVYTIRFSGNAMRIAFGDNGATPTLLRDIVSRLGDGVAGITSAARMFRGATNITQFTQADWFDAASVNVNQMVEMFCNAIKFNQDIGAWNVGKVKDMESMFYNARAFNQDIGGWSVSNVTKMITMFQNAVEFNQDIGAWNVGKVTSMDGMFNGAIKFNQDIGAWDVSKVTSMSAMFYNCAAFNQDIGAWNVGNVTTMADMFYNCVAFNQDIGAWNVGKVTTMASMFGKAWAFNQNLGAWNVSKVKNMNSMFYQATAFKQNISQWRVEAVENFGSFLLDAALPTDCYNHLLLRWSTQALKPSINFHGGNSKYDLGLPALRRQSIHDAFYWTITDGGVSGKKYAENGVKLIMR